MKDEVRVPLCLEWSNNQIVGATVIHEETRLHQNVKKNRKERMKVILPKPTKTIIEQEVKRRHFFKKTHLTMKDIVYNCCLYCGPSSSTTRSIDYINLAEQLKQQSLIGQPRVLQCTTCYRKACFSCLQKFVSVLKENCNLNHLCTTSEWVLDVCNFVASDGAHCNNNYVGSCCNFVLEDDRDDLACFSVKKIKENRADLHIINANLIIPTTIGTSIVVNGFGQDVPIDNIEKKMIGLVHGVTTESTVYNANSLTGTKSHKLLEKQQSVTIRDPFTFKKKTVRYLLCLLLSDNYNFSHIQ